MNKISKEIIAMKKSDFMNVIKLTFALALLALPAAAEESTRGSTTKLRVVAYNVACGQWATPEQIAELLKPLKPDIVLLSEVPKANPGKKSEGLVPSGSGSTRPGSRTRWNEFVRGAQGS